MRPSLTLPFRTFVLAALALFVGACSSPEPARKLPPPPIPLSAEQSFFDGAIVAQVNLAPPSDVAVFQRPEPKQPGRDLRLGKRGEVPGELPPGYARPPVAPGFLAPVGPPATVRLALTNRGATPVRVRVAEFSSALGNFAIQPDTFTLAPGESAQPEPMSTHRASGLTEVRAILELRTAEREERRELTLRRAN